MEKKLKNKRTFEIIDNKKATIIRPKKSGFGTTGIFIDSLWIAGSGVDRFQLNGHNLRTANEEALLKALRTIKFFPKK